MKKFLNFAKKYPVYIATIHAIGGIGVGIILASPVAGIHPVRWGAAFILASIIGHMYIWFTAK